MATVIDFDKWRDHKEVNMATVIDFDKWRAEKAAKDGEVVPDPVVFTIGGKDYLLPSEPPATVVLDVVRMKEAEGSEADVPLSLLQKIGDAIFGAENFREILEVNKIGATEMGDLIVEAFRAWPGEVTKVKDADPLAEPPTQEPST